MRIRIRNKIKSKIKIGKGSARGNGQAIKWDGFAEYSGVPAQCFWAFWFLRK